MYFPPPWADYFFSLWCLTCIISTYMILLWYLANKQKCSLQKSLELCSLQSDNKIAISRKLCLKKIFVNRMYSFGFTSKRVRSAIFFTWCNLTSEWLQQFLWAEGLVRRTLPSYHLFWQHITICIYRVLVGCGEFCCLFLFDSFWDGSATSFNMLIPLFLFIQWCTHPDLSNPFWKQR